MVSLYHNSSVWLDNRDTSGWDGSPTHFTSARYLTSKIEPQ